MSIRAQVFQRREKVKELLIQGYTQKEIAKVLHRGLRTIERDVNTIKNELMEDAKKYTCSVRDLNPCLRLERPLSLTGLSLVFTNLDERSIHGSSRN